MREHLVGRVAGLLRAAHAHGALTPRELAIQERAARARLGYQPGGFERLTKQTRPTAGKASGARAERGRGAESTAR